MKTELLFRGVFDKVNSPLKFQKFEEFSGYYIFWVTWRDIIKKDCFKDKRSRPRFTIEITTRGKKFVNQLIETYISIYPFFQILQKFKYFEM
ncbi:hypothetical protein LCGC14_0860880 [marine sediment metagenome]|uniref:Uncharacterized protein n=1 Tax=marine sediment metagenome TaxID=412755 RepID=A0A0F9PCG8_9ZZZZ|nr:hypothetical protein [bacterium]